MKVTLINDLTWCNFSSKVFECFYSVRAKCPGIQSKEKTENTLQKSEYPGHSQKVNSHFLELNL